MELRCRDLSKTFRGKAGEVEALQSVHIRPRRARDAVHRRPSGCGKSTLLRILAGLVEADSGTVTAHGARDGERPLNALVFQLELPALAALGAAFYLLLGEATAEELGRLQRGLSPRRPA